MAATTLKALVLGGQNGMLGQALVRALKQKGWEVETVSGKDVDYFSSSLHDDLARYLDRFEPSALFNAVAYTNVELAEEQEEEAMVLNRGVPATLGRLAKTRPCKLIHYSTDFVFDGRKKSPYSIDDPTSPLSVYGRSKLEGEQALQELDLPDCAIIRTAWLFGQGKMNFVRKIMDICRERGEASVVFDQIGSPTYAQDLAVHSLELVEMDGRGLFHIANSGQASWCELADEAAGYLQLECRVNPVASADFKTKAVRPAYSVLDLSSFTQLTGAMPRTWPQALREYLMLEFPDGI
ncbi:dTDP-4-dehydrorhamnose reductase [Desulfovibrio sp. OttesenSCG-928-C14]|nr:dTDP-4-dehydrorhamnose reductase [Desulfovibrio sp. OttesenSCG-928-C14]